MPHDSYDMSDISSEELEHSAFYRHEDEDDIDINH